MSKKYLALLVFVSLLFSTSGNSFAEEAKLTAQGPNPVKQSLENLKGKVVTLRMSSGEEISGQVADVGDFAVLLSQLAGKEFYNAVVPIDYIDAVSARAK